MKLVSGVFPQERPFPQVLRLDTRGPAAKSSGVARPHRLVAQDVGFSARKPGFDSPWGYSGLAQVSRTVRESELYG